MKPNTADELTFQLNKLYKTNSLSEISTEFTEATTNCLPSEKYANVQNNIQPSVFPEREILRTNKLGTSIALPDLGVMCSFM